MLDNVVEVNGLPLQSQRDEIASKRRHGMGFLGLGSTLAMLRMAYGSLESVAFTDKAAKDMAIEGWREALELAKEKGPAPILAQEFDVTSAMLAKRPEMETLGWKVGDKIRGSMLHARFSRYMQRLATEDPALVKELMEVGARFTHHTSVAPTGTIALSIANNASNGIEPSFAHRYSRNVIRPGKKTKEKVDVESYELLAYRALIDGEADPDAKEGEHKLPDYFVAADSITPKAHVDIQAAAQKWVDSSISKTINVATDIPFAEFQGVLVKEKDLANTTYRFELEDGSVVEAKGNDEVEYDGEIHTAANLFDALKEGYYGKF
jgi:ribonucleoside-diphosphate reductase alpha chain